MKLFRRSVDESKVSIEREGSRVFTRGLTTFGQRELVVDDVADELQEEAREFLAGLVVYLGTIGRRRIEPEETVPHGFWIVKFRERDNELLAWERADDGEEWVPGATRALRFARDQKRVCERHNSPFWPPNGDSLVVVSEGVWEGRRLEGLRYHAPEHMSGWWLLTDLYDGNVASVRTEHAYHLVERRPELVPFLALAPGFWFRSGDPPDVHFDRSLLDDEEGVTRG